MFIVKPFAATALTQVAGEFPSPVESAALGVVTSAEPSASASPGAS
jgi:hypothetical protein